ENHRIEPGVARGEAAGRTEQHPARPSAFDTLHVFAPDVHAAAGEERVARSVESRSSRASGARSGLSAGLSDRSRERLRAAGRYAEPRTEQPSVGAATRAANALREALHSAGLVVKEGEVVGARLALRSAD